MSDEHTGTRTRRSGAPASDDASTGPVRSSMLARRWLLAYYYSSPEAHDVPVLPEWTVTRPADGGIAFAAGDDDEPFVQAAQLMRVRR